MSSEERGVVKGVGVKFPQSEVIGGVEWLEMAPRISMSAFELYDRYAPGVAFESLSQSCSLPLTLASCAHWTAQAEGLRRQQSV